MKELRAGNRQGTLLQVIILSAVLILGAVVVGMAIVSLHTASVAKDTAWLTQKRYEAGQNEIYQLCRKREAIEANLKDLERYDVALQQAQIAIESHNTFVSARVRTERIKAFTQKMSADLAYLVTPIEDGCERLKP